MNTNLARRIDDRMVQRVCGEFLEMPGLSLTFQQARRLWALDDDTCRELLDFLVDEKFLCRQPHDTYVRTSDGFTERPRLQKMGKARDTARRMPA